MHARRPGHTVHVVDVRAEVARAFGLDSGFACESPAELARQCEVIVNVVVNASQTETMLFGENGCAGAMRPVRVFVMCSTVDPKWSGSAVGAARDPKVHYRGLANNANRAFIALAMVNHYLAARRAPALVRPQWSK